MIRAAFTALVCVASGCAALRPPAAGIERSLAHARLAMRPEEIVAALGEVATVSQARCEGNACAACLDFSAIAGCAVFSSDAAGTGVTVLGAASHDEASSRASRPRGTSRRASAKS